MKHCTLATGEQLVAGTIKKHPSRTRVKCTAQMIPVAAYIQRTAECGPTHIMGECTQRLYTEIVANDIIGICSIQNQFTADDSEVIGDIHRVGIAAHRLRGIGFVDHQVVK